MPGREDQDSESRFAVFIEALVDIIGHADRAAPLRDYCTGLLMPAERKSRAQKR
jgi:SRSO17 transposase